MKTQATTIPPKPVDPEVRVSLDLSVAEFAMLANLVYCHLGGDTALRRDIEIGVREALNSLPLFVRPLAVRASRISKSTDGWNSENVSKAFA